MKGGKIQQKHVHRTSARLSTAYVIHSSSTLPHRQPDMSLVQGYSSDEDGDTIQTDAFGISDLPVAKKVRTDVSGQKIVPDAAPHVLAEVRITAAKLTQNLIHNRTPSIRPRSSHGPRTRR